MDDSSSLVIAKKQKFLSIDIMRGLAILMVIFVHTAQHVDGDRIVGLIATYGQMGVQMFFVASAFTLCYSIESRGFGKGSLKNFYIRRYFRIAPLYYLGIILYFVATSLATDGWESDKHPINIIANILFLHGLYPSANNTVVPGGWSIGTEMLFYLIFPFLYLFYKKLQSKYKITFLVFPIIILILSLTIQFVLLRFTSISTDFFINNSFVYYSILNQLPVFCLGMSLYTAFKEQKLENINKITCYILILIGTLIAGFLMLFGESLFTLSSAIFPFISALTFVFLFILLQYFNKNKGCLIAKIGEFSYAGYIIHFIFAFYLAPVLSDALSFIQADLKLIIVAVIIITVTCLSANIIHKYIELKGIKLGKKFISYVDKRDTKQKEAS